LIQLALAVAVDRALVVHAAADLARAAVAVARPDDATARRAIAVAAAWLEGNATSSHAWAIGFAASEAADREEDERGAAAARAAAFVAVACDDRADSSFYAHRGYAAKAAEAAAIALSHEEAAALVRARIPLSSFLGAYDVASQPPPPLPEAEPDAERSSDSFYA
jgi:hypothetical protein